MIYIEDGRSSFYQWDIGQRLIVDNPDVTEVHYSNNLKDPALICEVYEEGGLRYANVPNILLQQPNTLLVHGCCEECVRESLRIRVIMRAKPADYVYTETEVRTFDGLQRQAEEAIASATDSARAAAKAAAAAVEAADRAEAAADGQSSIDDDVISDESVWSSRSTVDRLCPEFSTRGATAVFHSIEKYPLQVVTHVEVAQSGSGDPSPDNIRPIMAYDSLVLTQSSGNLFGGNELVQVFRDKFPKGTSVDETTKTITYNPASDARAAVFTQFKPDTRYTFILRLATTQGNRDDEHANLAVEYTDGTRDGFMLKAFDTVEDFMYVSQSGKSVNRFITSLSGGTTTLYYEHCGIFEGVRDLDNFTPYRVETHTAHLDEAIYTGTYDWTKGTLISEWVYRELDGSENWQLTSGTTKYFSLQLGPKGEHLSTALVSSHYKYVDAIAGSPYNVARVANSSTGVDLLIIRPDMDVYTTAAEFKSFLTKQAEDGTPVQVAYQRVESVEKQIAAPGTIPALGGENNLWIDGCELEVSGRADPTRTIKALEKRLAALETAIVNNI